MSSCVLFSGGVDSTVLAAELQARSKLAGLVFVDYGQPASDNERVAALSLHDAHFPEVPMFCGSMHWAGVDAAFAIGAGRPGPRIMAGRNAMLLAYAIPIAASFSADRIAIGCNKNDAAIYPDCAPGTFLMPLDRVFRAGYGIGVSAPLAHLSRASVLAKSSVFGLRLELCFSCYEPEDEGACGHCDGCMQTVTVAAIEAAQAAKVSK